MTRTKVELDAATLQLAKDRMDAGRSAEAAMRGDFELLADRAAAGTPLGKPELDFIAALLRGELPHKIKLNRKSIRRPDQEEFERLVVNLVLAKTNSGIGITQAVTDVEEDLKGTDVAVTDRTIWTYVDKWLPDRELLMRD